MLGHPVSATLWQVSVHIRTDDLSDPKSKSYAVRHINVITATNDGSDVFEIARKEFYASEEEAAKFEFRVIQVQHVGQVNGTAVGTTLGAFEARGLA